MMINVDNIDSSWSQSLACVCHIRHVSATTNIQGIVKEDPRTRDEPPARPALGHVAVLFAFGTRPIDIPLVRRRGLRTHAIVD